jgi:hypothetical protein
MNAPATSLPIPNNIVAQNIGQETMQRMKYINVGQCHSPLRIYLCPLGPFCRLNGNLKTTQTTETALLTAEE